MPVSDAYHFKQVDDRLSTAGVVSEEQLGELKDEGYGAVISLLPADSQYAIPDEPQIVTAQGLSYTYIPVDFAAPTESDYQQFVAAMQANADSKLLVHCAANYRVSAFYSIYAVQHLDWTEAQAREFMGSIWNLADYPVWEAFVAEMLKD